MQSNRDSLYRQAGEQFAPALARLARAMERDPDRARDLEQEIHCALWASLSRFNGDCALKTWVYRVAHNAVADHVARSSRRPSPVTLDEVGDLPGPADPEGDAGESLVLQQVRGLIRHLPPLDAQVILLWLEGESGAEIGSVTGLSAAAVAVRVHRLKAMFKRHFTPDSDEGEEA